MYFDYETNESVQDATNFVTRLHNCILTECSKYIASTGIAELLLVDEIELSEESIQDFGDVDSIVYMLEKELSSQYVTWKREVIDLLHRYVCDEEVAIDGWGSFCLGNTSFHAVWEKACKVAFGDQLNATFKEAGLKPKGAYQNSAMKIKEVIPCPEWYKFENGDDEFCGTVKTLVPDTIVMRKIYGKKVFAVLDAKYYHPRLGKTPEGVPELESITKQFLYQSAYQEFVKTYGFDRVVNAFLVPSFSSEAYKMGYVKFDGVVPSLGKPFSSKVDMWALPAKKIWQCFLDSRRLCDEEIYEILGAQEDGWMGERHGSLLFLPEEINGQSLLF